MDSVCADTNTTLTNSAEAANSNGTMMDQSNPNNHPEQAGAGGIDQPQASTSQQQQDQPQTYDDLFPSLPMGRSGATNAPKANPIGEWNKKPMILSSTVTQVNKPTTFHDYFYFFYFV